MSVDGMRSIFTLQSARNNLIKGMQKTIVAKCSAKNASRAESDLVFLTSTRAFKFCRSFGLIFGYRYKIASFVKIHKNFFDDACLSLFNIKSVVHRYF